jgi:putative membrane protein
MLASVIAFLESFIAGLGFLAAFLAAYTLVLPLREWRLIREGNVAAAVVLGGSLIGFTLPLAEAVRQSSQFSEMILWSAIALIVQLLAFFALRLLRRDAAAAIERGDMAEAVLLASASIALGLLCAASLA